MKPVLVLQFAERDPLGRLDGWLTDAGLTLEVRRADRGELPDSLDDYGGLVVLGGPMRAVDDAVHPWLAQVRALLRAAVAEDVPTLGICLGAQLLAASSGGRVGPLADGPEIGSGLIAKRTSAAADPLFRELPIAPDVIQWHWDEITALPPGAIQLASSVVCENQAFRLGRLAWGLQGHIETTPELVRGWAAATAAQLPEYDLDLVVERAVGVHDDLAEVWEPFARRFAGVVRDPDAVEAANTVPTSTSAPLTDPAAIRAALAAEAQAARAPGVFQIQPRRPQ